jgi:hypothetical protein
MLNLCSTAPFGFLHRRTNTAVLDNLGLGTATKTAPVADA